MSWSRRDRNRFERLLRRLSRSLGGDIDRLSANATNLSHNRFEGDLSDDANQAYDEGLLMVLLERQASTLQEVEDALERIADGTYGYCETCDEKIPRERLSAIPYARECVKCAAREVRPSGRWTRTG